MIEILGCDSPEINSIGVQEMWGQHDDEAAATADAESVRSSQSATPVPNEQAAPSLRTPSVTAPILPCRRMKMVYPKHPSTAEFDEMQEFKKRKLQLEIENLELQNYKLKMDCYEQEYRLKLPNRIQFPNEDEGNEADEYGEGERDILQVV